LEEIRNRILVYDGAMGTQILDLNLAAADYGGPTQDGCPEILAVTRPDAIRDIHRAYLDAGADILETDTFTGTRLKLDDYKLGGRTYEINRAAAQLAREAADEFSTDERPRFVAGSMGPTGMLPSSDDPSLSNITYQQLAELYREQAVALIEGGVNVLLIETSQDVLEVRAAITGIRRACAEAGRMVPIQAQVTLDTSGRMLLGTDIAAAATILYNLRVDMIGLNCSTGPDHMRDSVRWHTENIPPPISTTPYAGRHHVGGRRCTIRPIRWRRRCGVCRRARRQRRRGCRYTQTHPPHRRAPGELPPEQRGARASAGALILSRAPHRKLPWPGGACHSLAGSRAFAGASGQPQGAARSSRRCSGRPRHALASRASRWRGRRARADVA
jgi:5-methyltetrahydrofolate--homocysteine methyltransferase